MDIVCQEKEQLLILGDFNIHYDKISDGNRWHLCKLLETHNLVQHVQGPTHQSGHTLDLVITREDDGLI